ncbi:squalene--hopene cyclase [Cohnella silvisoli]|uniref:Squalene--hopene cyclase n=1 Tax=Cohnella silvisoli TaxID=2873699 RepID=A0ABV1L4W2_9BACL|nr:squalene--hopene cyclase [Cohnella silvisoli]MCD9026091.1 squalene--hopene cyclase [Cohnella silvisoli]
MREIRRLSDQLLRLQTTDGSWRFCFESGVLTDAYMIIMLRTLEIADETLIRRLHERLLSAQQADGSWRVYSDEIDGNLSATVEAYYALLYSGYIDATDDAMLQAKRYILSKGGLRSINGVITKVILASTGQYRWPASLMIPLEFLLLPPSFPISFYDFSGYARVHLAPVLLLADRKFSVKTNRSPDLSNLMTARSSSRPEPSHSFDQRQSNQNFQALLDVIKTNLGKLPGFSGQLHKAARKRAERYMLERIEPDGTLYGYATCTFLMVFALLSAGYDKRHPVINRAVHGITSLLCRKDGKIFLQNSLSTVWDTALISSALQEAGTSPDSPMIRRASSYILSQQQLKFGDWSIRNRNPVPGAWGFSDSNTLNPDIDDTTAALRAIKRMSLTSPVYRDAWNRGLNWILSMQNKDGGWPAFERDTDKAHLTWLPMDGAKSAAIDPSTADLTGRTLEYLGRFAGLGIRHSFIRRGADWLIEHQEKDGSWYGRWGICYIYGTWAALTGMISVGIDPDHSALRRGTEWLLSIQNNDGGWGESCGSDREMKYIPLGASTPSQTAWALDALIAAHRKPVPEIDKGIGRLIEALHEEDWKTSYPTGAGLPGSFYVHYHSYRFIWPLLTLSHYIKKYGGDIISAVHGSAADRT